MRKMRSISWVGLAIIVAIILAGCGTFGESHNYNAPAPYRNLSLRWERLESPGNYHTIIHSCYGMDGLYLTQADNNSITVVPNDPMCSVLPIPTPQPNASPIAYVQR